MDTIRPTNRSSNDQRRSHPECATIGICTGKGRAEYNLDYPHCPLNLDVPVLMTERVFSRPSCWCSVKLE